jgi:hypothetical protein
MVLYHLSGLNLIVGHAADPPELWITRGVQVHLLDLLGINLTGTG